MTTLSGREQGAELTPEEEETFNNHGHRKLRSMGTGRRTPQSAVSQGGSPHRTRSSETRPGWLNSHTRTCTHAHSCVLEGWGQASG